MDYAFSECLHKYFGFYSAAMRLAPKKIPNKMNNQRGERKKVQSPVLVALSDRALISVYFKRIFLRFSRGFNNKIIKKTHPSKHKTIKRRFLKSVATTRCTHDPATK